MAAKRAYWLEFFHRFVSFPLPDFLSMICKNIFTPPQYLHPTVLPQNCLHPEVTQFAHCDCDVSKLSERASRRCPLRVCCSNSLTRNPITSSIRVCNGASHQTPSWRRRQPQNIRRLGILRFSGKEQAKCYTLIIKNYIKGRFGDWGFLYGLFWITINTINPYPANLENMVIFYQC